MTVLLSLQSSVNFYRYLSLKPCDLVFTHTHFYSVLCYPLIFTYDVLSQARLLALQEYDSFDVLILFLF